MARNPEDIMLEQAIANLGDSPTAIVLEDILLNQFYNPAIDEPENFKDSVLSEINPQAPEVDGALNVVNSGSPQTVSVSTGFDYNDYTNPDYLSTVAGKTLEVVNPATGQKEIRVYSKGGHSYSVAVEDGGLKSHRVTTTHNEFTNNPNADNYSGLNDFNKETQKLDASYIPYAVGGMYFPGSTALVGAVDWLFGGNQEEE